MQKIMSFVPKDTINIMGAKSLVQYFENSENERLFKFLLLFLKTHHRFSCMTGLNISIKMYIISMKTKGSGFYLSCVKETSSAQNMYYDYHLLEKEYGHSLRDFLH